MARGRVLGAPRGPGPERGALPPPPLPPLSRPAVFQRPWVWPAGRESCPSTPVLPDNLGLQQPSVPACLPARLPLTRRGQALGWGLRGGDSSKLLGDARATAAGPGTPPPPVRSTALEVETPRCVPPALPRTGSFAGSPGPWEMAGGGGGGASRESSAAVIAAPPCPGGPGRCLAAHRPPGQDEASGLCRRWADNIWTLGGGGGEESWAWGLEALPAEAQAEDPNAQPGSGTGGNMRPETQSAGLGACGDENEGGGGGGWGGGGGVCPETRRRWRSCGLWVRPALSGGWEAAAFPAGRSFLTRRVSQPPGDAAQTCSMPSSTAHRPPPTPRAGRSWQRLVFVRLWAGPLGGGGGRGSAARLQPAFEPGVRSSGTPAAERVLAVGSDGGVALGPRFLHSPLPPHPRRPVIIIGHFPDGGFKLAAFPKGFWGFSGACWPATDLAGRRLLRKSPCVRYPLLHHTSTPRSRAARPALVVSQVSEGQGPGGLGWGSWLEVCHRLPSRHQPGPVWSAWGRGLGEARLCFQDRWRGRGGAGAGAGASPPGRWGPGSPRASDLGETEPPPGPRHGAGLMTSPPSDPPSPRLDLDGPHRPKPGAVQEGPANEKAPGSILAPEPGAGGAPGPRRPLGSGTLSSVCAGVAGSSPQDQDRQGLESGFSPLDVWGCKYGRRREACPVLSAASPQDPTGRSSRDPEPQAPPLPQPRAPLSVLGWKSHCPLSLGQLLLPDGSPAPLEPLVGEGQMARALGVEVLDPSGSPFSPPGDSSDCTSPLPSPEAPPPLCPDPVGLQLKSRPRS
ncbi:collagen alpha-1(I) chain-like [Phacochoerus africanus]|uniref:collagen alpha-1(I) chain-like n=1 Tax=Phacochoerus africanus TaxID=41426 RepID=UPI001FD879B6|nr:collagen alpha-1(I) chain-like [Phacochoerus africanus]